MKAVQDFEKWDRRQTDGETDNASIKEACASKNNNVQIPAFHAREKQH